MNQQFKVERRMLSGFGWRWCVIKNNQLICHCDLFTDADRLRAGLEVYQPSEQKPLTQADIERRPPGFIPQGSMRQLLWKAGKDNQRAA